MIMKSLLLICAVLVSQVAVAADVFDRYKPRPFNLADKLEADANIGGYPIWQGEKQWRLFNIASIDTKNSVSNVPMGRVGLFQTEGKTFIALMTVDANLAEGSASDFTSEPCKRDDLLFKASLGGKFSNINCATINHITNFPGNPGGRDAELYSLIKEQGVDVPPTVLRFRFTRYTSHNRVLEVSLFINPELAGFPREVEPQWGRSPWHRSQAFNDPEKKRFVDNLGAWALQFAKQMDMAFEKNNHAFTSVPSWRSVIAALPLADPIKPKVLEETTKAGVAKSPKEDQLKELQRLYDLGLIAEAVFHERQRAVLNQ